jgi:hypothetical protein
MPAFSVCLPLIAIVFAQLAFATDVQCTLTTSDGSEFAEQPVSTLLSEVVKERGWVATGIEERTISILYWCSEAIQVPRIGESEPDVRAPDWIDDALWPRTKEVLHYANVPPPKLVPLRYCHFACSDNSFTIGSKFIRV